MQDKLGFSIDSWSAWAPGLESPEAWRDWYSDRQELPRAEGIPDVRDLPAGMRRRLSLLGKMALRVALDAGQADTTRIVFSSRYGNVLQMLQLLQTMAVDEPISPTGFGMSVHNSLVGMLSIITKNVRSQTAIAAGSESFCMGLVEALGLLAENPHEPVMLIHCDDVLPEFYTPFQDHSVRQCALALVITSQNPAQNHLTLNFAGGRAAAGQDDPIASFLKFMIGGLDDWSWTGAQGKWSCHNHV
ncbi:beta-ketoacyl synthase chain length factor [Sneathiella marina]|uniref:Beta-ketoacyl synthase chain length factor n=1 Tax=Sneathiella marina TaxID=2950108 RepID=A0ABY4W6Z3_9PROT|nr:beta-ketoacyl synthase chain length factor [Sneathiella marina]USG62611.1 beta-ketoacyl synthase chain length factor [Sneathiella marina]